MMSEQENRNCLRDVEQLMAKRRIANSRQLAEICQVRAVLWKAG